MPSSAPCAAKPTNATTLPAGPPTTNTTANVTTPSRNTTGNVNMTNVTDTITQAINSSVQVNSTANGTSITTPIGTVTIGPAGITTSNQTTRINGAAQLQGAAATLLAAVAAAVALMM